MPRWVNTLGKSTLAVAICDRCRMKRARADLVRDPNIPGLIVCADCADKFDPYRLPAHGPEQIIVDGVRLDERLTIPTFTPSAGASRLVLDGANILLPDGTPFFPFGTNQRWELAQQRDAAYIRSTIGATWVRIEFPWWQQGSAGEGRDDNSPGNIAPAYLAKLIQLVGWYTEQGLWVDIALHSKCGRSGTPSDSDDGLYCALPDDPSAWPNGRNFWTDPTERAKVLETLAFIAATFKDTPGIGAYEPLNEPDPPGYTSADVAAFYVEAMDAMLAQDPRAIFIIGGTGGYSPAKIDGVYIPGRSNVIYTFDWFDQPGTDPNNPKPISERETSLKSRLQRPLAFRDGANVPILPQQFGSHYGVDTAREILQYQLTQLAKNKVPGFQWELRAPTVGPVAGASTYGWVWNRGDGIDTIRATDEALMISAASYFESLKGTRL